MGTDLNLSPFPYCYTTPRRAAPWGKIAAVAAAGSIEIGSSMKVLLDFLPVLLFFLTYFIFTEKDFLTATGVMIVAVALQTTFSWIRQRRIEKLNLIVLGLVIVFGGATLLLKDPLYVKWKTTVVEWLFAAAFIGSQFIGKKTFTERMLEHVVTAPRPVWTRLNSAWVGFFLFVGAANLYVTYNFDNDAWVNFKFFGILGLTLAFIFAQGLYLVRYMKTDDASSKEDA